MRDRFMAANVTRDGRLTAEQARAGGMMAVFRHFAEIDRDQKGYVTLEDIRLWHQAMHAQKMGQAGPPPGGGYPGAGGGAYPPPAPAGGYPNQPPPPPGQGY
jgi:hypothetical protein